MTASPLVVRCRGGCDKPTCPSLKQRAGKATVMAQMNRPRRADICSVTLALPEPCKANSDQLVRIWADASDKKALDKDSESTSSTAATSSGHSTDRLSTPVRESQPVISPATRHGEMSPALTPSTTKARVQSPSVAHSTPRQSTSALTVSPSSFEGNSLTQVATPPTMHRVSSTAISSATSVPLECCRAEADPIKGFDDDKDLEATSSRKENLAPSPAKVLLSKIHGCREVTSAMRQHGETLLKETPTTTKATAITASEECQQRKGAGTQSLPVARRSLKHLISELTRCQSITEEEPKTQVVTPPTMAMMSKVNGTSSIRLATCASRECLTPDADQLARRWAHLGPIQGFDEEAETTNSSIATPPLGSAWGLSSPETPLVASTNQKTTAIAPLGGSLRLPVAAMQSMPRANTALGRSAPPSMIRSQGSTTSESLIPDADWLVRSQGFDEEAEAEAARILSSPILGSRAVLSPGTQHGSSLLTGTQSPPVAKASPKQSTSQLSRSPWTLDGGQLVREGTQSLPLAKLESRPALKRSTSEPAFSASMRAEVSRAQVLTIMKYKSAQMKGSSAVGIHSEAQMGCKTDLASTCEHPGSCTGPQEAAHSNSNRKGIPAVPFAKVLSSPVLRCREITSPNIQHDETPLTMSPITIKPTASTASEGSPLPKGTRMKSPPVPKLSLKHSTSEVTICPSITEGSRPSQVVTAPTMAMMAKMNGTSIRFAACASPVSSPQTPVVISTNANTMAPLGGSMRLPVRANTSLGQSALPNMIRPQGSLTARATTTGGDPTQAAQTREACSKLHRYHTVTLGACLNLALKVTVVAPGGGTVMNRSVYSKLKQTCGISLEIVGQSGSPYDRYPEAWGPTAGGASPNLESFAVDLVSQGTLGRCDCLVVGSRGGQVCLPTFWRMKGEEVPPAVILNGGCAMKLPISVPWPNSAVTFLLIGGKDYFRQKFTVDQYLHDVRSRVPHNNATTAILMVQEMAHMPQAQLLDAILHPMVQAVTSWKADRQIIPTAQFEQIMSAVSALGFHGSLIYKTGLGDAWRATGIPEVHTRWQTACPQTAHTQVVRKAAPSCCD